MDAEDVVVARKHVHGGRVTGGVGNNLDLRIVDTGEVASAGGLVLLGLEREGVGVHTGNGAAGVMVVGLDLVEVLALLLLETVLTVEDELEGVEDTTGLLSEAGVTTTGTDLEEGSTRRGGGDEGVGVAEGILVRLEHNVGGNGGIGEVPEGVLGRGVGEAPDELLDGVVVREADLLGAGSGDGIGASVLDLLNEVLVALLRKSPTFLGVKVDVVGPHLEDRGAEEGIKVRREVEIDADLVVLQSN